MMCLVYDVSNEKLFSATEDEVRTILGYCGLPCWSESCLVFTRPKERLRP